MSGNDLQPDITVARHCLLDALSRRSLPTWPDQDCAAALGLPPMSSRPETTPPGMRALGTAEDLLRLIAGDGWRMAVLRAVRGLGLPDCWVGAGFVRALVWDRLHGYERPTPLADVDVVYFDRRITDRAVEDGHERRLAALWPAELAAVPWSVRNQARMHSRNGDAPYGDTADALRHWLETPTAVAVRLNADDGLELLAPFGLADLYAMRIAPTPHALDRRWAAYRDRVESKPWRRQWPRVRIVSSADRSPAVP